MKLLKEKEMLVLSLIVVILAMFCVAGCVFHAAAETTMGAAKSGNWAATNIKAGEPHGIYGNFAPSPDSKTIEGQTGEKSRPARD